MGDGHLGKCKECTKRDVAERVGRLSTNIGWVEKEAERCRIKSRNKRHGETPEMAAARQRKYRAKSREKYKAHCAVSNAVRDGRIVRAPCEVCGEKAAEGHHDDYSKPLEVRWLCRKHHTEVHVEINRKRRAERVAQRLAQLAAA
jgi:hypothetical protein